MIEVMRICSDSGYILRVEPTWFANKLDMGYEKQKVRDDYSEHLEG